MSKPNEIPANVMEMINASADWVGKCEAESFSCGAFAELSETEHKQSPIEMILQVAIQTVARINEIRFSEPLSASDRTEGLMISPQFQIGKYRADFVVFYQPSGGNPCRVVVECDGTAFHERTELERRREKARDRFMQKAGWTVFRFTGTEIMAAPYKVAAEIIDHVSGHGDILTPEEYFS